MKKPTRRNANKALCAYFTFGDRSRKVGIAEGTWFGVCVNKESHMGIGAVEIRKLGYEDLDQLTATFESEFSRTHQDDLIDQEQNRISFYVAWLQSDPIGHGLVHWDGARDPEISKVYPGCPEIYRMSVLQEFQSRGVGTRILQACEQEAID